MRKLGRFTVAPRRHQGVNEMSEYSNQESSEWMTSAQFAGILHSWGINQTWFATKLRDGKPGDASFVRAMMRGDAKVTKGAALLATRLEDHGLALIEQWSNTAEQTMLEQAYPAAAIKLTAYRNDESLWTAHPEFEELGVGHKFFLAALQRFSEQSQIPVTFDY